jgi:thioredoxin-related protein
MNKKSLFSLLLVGLFCMPFSIINWHYNFEEAKQIAQKEHKHILLNFSGSDWCGPCIRLHKEIFENVSFQEFASKNLVMVNADFPRLKKNQLTAAQQKINDAIAERYNSKGSFPLTLLLNETGKILKEWDGYPKVTADALADDMQWAIDHAE